MDINEEAKKEQLIRELNILGTSKLDSEPCPFIVKYYGAYFREVKSISKKEKKKRNRTK